jgi:AcrR family transcriptional regulator
MGLENASTISDRQSEKAGPRRGRPPFPRALVLAAADALFAESEAPQTVSMDDIAAAAGVGKGTLFRAFGSRDKLLDTLFGARVAALREAIESGEPPVGPTTPPRERVLGILDALLVFKLENRRLIQARESARSGRLQGEWYRWLHDTLRTLIEQARSPEAAAIDVGYAAHVLLSALRPALVDEMLASGDSPEAVRSAQAAFAGRILG